MILITGSGISGTTWMWWLMKELGYTTQPTGTDTLTYELLKHKRLVSEIVKGEREWPEVVKHLGGFLKHMNQHIDEHGWDVDHVFVMIRKMEASIDSRRSQGNLTHGSLGIPRKEFKSLHQALRDDMMKEVLKSDMGSCIYNLIERDHPFTIIRYPRAAVDRVYCWDQMREALGDRVKWEAFIDAWEQSRRCGEGIQKRHFIEEGVEPDEKLLSSIKLSSTARK